MRAALSPQPETNGPAQMDARGLHALAQNAARSLGEEEQALRDRRGPFRPGKLVSSRARHDGAAAARVFGAVDLVALGALSLACALATAPAPLLSAPLRALLPFSFAFALAAAGLKSAGLYRFGRLERLNLHLLKLFAVIAAATAGALGLAAIVHASAREILGVEIWSALALLAGYGLHVGWWLLVCDWRASGRLTPNVVVVGATRFAERLIRDALERRDVNILGVFDDRLARSPESLVGVPILGDTDALLRHRITPYVDRVVVAVDPGARNRLRQIVDRLRVLPQEVSLLVDLETQAERSAALAKLADAPLARVSGTRGDEERALAKRIQDLVIGALVLLALSPVMAVIALLVRLDSPGPVLFRQKRHGFNSEIIVVWKFRTMRDDRSYGGGERQVSQNDDRITRIGRFLRRSSLDELPQLINVLKGEMSLVGPRPHPVGMRTGDIESARLVAEYAWRNRMKPGMTGWAAIKGSRGPLHSPAEVRRRVSLDIEYIERQSLWLDLYILLMTAPCLLGDGEMVR